MFQFCSASRAEWIGILLVKIGLTVKKLLLGVLFHPPPNADVKQFKTCTSDSHAIPQIYARTPLVIWDNGVSLRLPIYFQEQPWNLTFSIFLSHTWQCVFENCLFDLCTQNVLQAMTILMASEIACVYQLSCLFTSKHNRVWAYYHKHCIVIHFRYTAFLFRAI